MEDFSGLKDVSPFAAREAELHRSKAVKDSLKKERIDEGAGERQLAEISGWEAGLRDPARRGDSLAQLKDGLADLSRKADAAQDSDARRMARRLLRGTLAGARERGGDQGSQRLLNKYRPAGRGAFN